MVDVVPPLHEEPVYVFVVSTSSLPPVQVQAEAVLTRARTRIAKDFMVVLVGGYGFRSKSENAQTAVKPNGARPGVNYLKSKYIMCFKIKHP